jgi:hypothetical protein
MAEILEHRPGDAGRWERLGRAIQSSKLAGDDFADWVQQACEEVIGGGEATCSQCSLYVHDGPCVGEDATE